MSLLSGIRGAIAAAGHASADLAYADLVMDTGPVAWWPLDANLVDRIGGHNGIIGAGTEVHVGPLPVDSGGSLDCAGTNWISVDHAAALKPAVGSLMAWFKPTSIHDGTIMAANSNGQENDDFALRVNSDSTVSTYFQLGGATRLIQTSTTYYAAGQIIHALVTFNSGGLTLYLDGNKIAANTNHTTGLTNNTLDWRFGAQEVATGDGPLIFNGVIDEIAIWDRVLTRNEIYLLAQTGVDL